MRICNNFLFLYFIILLYIFILLFITFLFNIYTTHIVYTHINLTSISNSLIIFSCFYDKRYNSIRVIGIASRKIYFICKYKVQNTWKFCNYKYIPLDRDSSGNNFKNLYINILITVYNSTIPDTIVINNRVFNIINYENISNRKNVLCITTLKYFLSYNQLIQSLKIYNYYGVTDVYIYSSDAFLNLEMFKGLGDIKIHIIFIENEYHLKNSFYFGQTVKYNDCLYRNMFSSNYIIFTDCDEIIILNKIKSYNKLLSLFKEGDIYYFRSTICPTTNYMENKNFHIINDTYLINTLNCCMMNSFYHRKYILKIPYKFIKINVHYVDYLYEKCNHIYVKENYAYIHHSRIPTFLLMNHCSIWFYDISLKKLINY